MFEKCPDILTTKEASKVLKVGMNTIYDLINSGELCHIKIGRAIRVPKKCLIEFIENRITTNELFKEKTN